MIPHETEPRPAIKKALCLPASLEHLPMLLEQVRQIAESAGIADAQTARLELAVEEALVNICHYAYLDQAVPGVVRCRFAIQPDGLQIEIVDEGLPFNPLVQVDPDTDIDLDQRKPGGLGILLIKSLVSAVSYRREDHQNVLTIEMHH